MMPKSTSRFLFPLLLLLLVNCSNPTQVSEPETSAAVEIVADPLTWPSIVDNNWLTIHSLTELVYPESQDPATVWGTLISSDKPKAILDALEKKLQGAVAAGKITKEEADEKFQSFKNYDWGKDDTVETEFEKSVPDWKRGYAYVLKVPMGYRKSTWDYPMVVYLHGGQSTYPGQYNVFLDQFYMSSEDPYILVAPSKIEWDWDANKIEEVIEDVKANLRVNDDRIYMTGVSMGGRGTYIVAAALPDLFAALMPLSSHHGPYSYVKLAPLVAHLPIWTSHGDRDSISSYDVAAQMVGELERLGANVSFHTVVGGDHEGWDTIYRNSKTFDWLLSQQKVPSTTTPTPRPTMVPISTPIKNSVVANRLSGYSKV